MKLTITALSLLLSVSASVATSFDNFSAALAQVESSGNPKAVGDNGKAKGIFQIHEICFKDAAQYDKELAKFKYNDCFNVQVSKRVLYSYCARYEPKALKAGDWETLARLWNSGPGWAKKKSKTDSYWEKISRNLK